MFRRWLVLVLLALQLQPALAFMPDQVGALAVEIEHQNVHGSGQGHHHDDGLGFEPGDNGAPAVHVHHDGGHHAVLLPTVARMHLPPWVPAARADLPAADLPHPHLEGPLRPPRSTL